MEQIKSKNRFSYSLTLLLAMGIAVSLPNPMAWKVLYAQESSTESEVESDDLLIFNSGRTLAGSFISSDTRNIRFQLENNVERSYPRSVVNTVVLGVIRVSNAEGIIPGVPQYKRGQTLRGHFFLTGSLVSLAVLSYGAVEWLRLENEIGGRLSAKEIKRINDAQKVASTLAIVGGAAFIFVYTWHIMDWLYWGDNYNAFLSHSSHTIKKQEQKAFRILFLHRKDLAYQGRMGDLYQAQISFPF